MGSPPSSKEPDIIVNKAMIALHRPLIFSGCQVVAQLCLVWLNKKTVECMSRNSPGNGEKENTPKPIQRSQPQDFALWPEKL